MCIFEGEKTSIMFRIFISDIVLQGIINREERSAPAHRSYLYKLLKQRPVQVLTASDTDRFKSQPEEMLKNPSALYILDINAADALSIQRTYGVMCLSGEKPDIAPLIDVNDIHISNEREKLGRGWDSVLDSVEKLPSNALLLTDRYLFAFRHPNAGDGLANIKDIRHTEPTAATAILGRRLSHHRHLRQYGQAQHLYLRRDSHQA